MVIFDEKLRNNPIDTRTSTPSNAILVNSLSDIRKEVYRVFSSVTQEN